ncbi:hypothetical protein FACS1894170_04790 [Planctomycetales bacterium]|nr:hypothetical protein FACS1894170_04790 [Planctomycetales bacterium]
MTSIEDKTHFSSEGVQFEFYTENHFVISINVDSSYVERWILSLLSLSESLIKSISVVNTTAKNNLKITKTPERNLSKHKNCKSNQNIEKSILSQENKRLILQLTYNDIECIIKWYLNCWANTYGYESMILDIECQDRSVIMFSTR